MEIVGLMHKSGKEESSSADSNTLNNRCSSMYGTGTSRTDSNLEGEAEGLGLRLEVFLTAQLGFSCKQKGKTM